jgi:TolB-like protein/Flp pilus assembly protein TadD
MDDLRQASVYQFDDFHVDPVERVLRRAGAIVPLTPRVFDTLLYFVRHHGRVLEKDELMREIWPDAVVEENNLTQNVSTLRQALGEAGGERRYIVTVPGRGYRFAARVRGSAAAVGAAAPQGGSAIAVLPFVNMSADPENEYFCDGLAEELINALSKIEELKVAARTSAFTFKGRDARVADIGQVLGVNVILEGSVRRSGDRLRVTAQLIDVSSGYHLWSERYDREMRDVFAMQDDIALAVVEALKIKLLGGEKAAILKHHTGNPEAYDLYLKGRYFWSRTAPDDFRKSRDYFERAVESDPAFALGYCGLAFFYGFGSSWGVVPPERGWPQSEAAARKALALDAMLGEAHLSLAAWQMVSRRDWHSSQRELERAMTLNPRLAEVRSVLGLFQRARGRFDDAIAEGRRALQLDPLSVRFARNLGNTYHFARRYDEAIALYLEALEFDRGNAALLQDLGDAYERKGACDDAISAWHNAYAAAGAEPLASTLARVYAAEGFDAALRAAATVTLRRLEERTNNGGYVPAIEYARAYVRLEDTDRAFKWLEAASAERNAYALFLNTDPFYDTLRHDRRFAALAPQL